MCRQTAPHLELRRTSLPRVLSRSCTCRHAFLLYFMQLLCMTAPATHPPEQHLYRYRANPSCVCAALPRMPAGAALFSLGTPVGTLLRTCTAHHMRSACAPRHPCGLFVIIPPAPSSSLRPRQHPSASSASLGLVSIDPSLRRAPSLVWCSPPLIIPHPICLCQWQKACLQRSSACACLHPLHSPRFGPRWVRGAFVSGPTCYQSMITQHWRVVLVSDDHCSLVSGEEGARGAGAKKDGIETRHPTQHRDVVRRRE